ncbi:grasp-with-spasm system SPASM domain peptide maturase [Chryseobacterium tructae]|uniref:Grasp-with-spasm system SPASM domain peptide maturase n=1 Tax=Chryseobacterium tructae TaxID=1037380 RepID=A0ABV7Y1B5_9FLAO|nr:grasp-with-spasm system SPASM domain peptide maturase [Chryseobacterium tructae]MDN3694642.1 grasp-with-spasm system SPASM domain peptide maturase [Chryseobacterium tructae]
MKYFNLFTNVLMTKGATRILVSDLQRNTSELYPLEFYELIEDLKVHSIENILNHYDEESQEILDSYLNLLLEKEYGFITENNWADNFPSLSHEYTDSSTISDIFIEFHNLDFLCKIKHSMENLRIRHLIIFSENNLTEDEILAVDFLFENTPLENIDIYLPYHKQMDAHWFQKLNEKVSRISNLIVYRSVLRSIKLNNKLRFVITFTTEDLKISCCGKVDIKYFNTNLPKVLEAINHNSCLHKKIGIDKEGNIKNCPLMPGSFGNIQKISLEEALAHPDFKRYWNITKDSIEGCKECEFRYICTDCRAYTERSHSKEDIDVSKPLKCGYNPYTNEWKDWSKNPLKEKAIQYYGLQRVK